MRKLMFLLLLAGLLPYANAQQKVEKKGFMEDKTLFEELTNMKKKTDIVPVLVGGFRRERLTPYYFLFS